MDRPSRTGGQGDVRSGSEPAHHSPKSAQPQQSAIANQIRLHRPGDSEATIAVRCRLRKAQTFASVRAVRTQSDTARALRWMIAHEATAWTFAPADDETLKDIANALLGLERAANVFERV